MSEFQVIEKEDFGIIYFGYHNGKLWSELPDDYLKFLIEKAYVNDSIKQIAKKVLSQKYDVDNQYLMF